MYLLSKTRLFSGDPRFFVEGLLPAPVAELPELDLPLNLFLVLVGIIIPPFADGATQRDQCIGPLYLCHEGNDSVFEEKTQPALTLLSETHSVRTPCRAQVPKSKVRTRDFFIYLPIGINLFVPPTGFEPVFRG
jgi:hypothetical protein